MRLLGFLFLDYAQRKGSRNASSDMGLYLLSRGAPGGRDLFSASNASHYWKKGVTLNSGDERSRRLLAMLDGSP